jgi:peptide/nickel transport system permease protein
MTLYLAKRLLGMIPLLIGITLLTSLVIFFLPGGPTAGIMGDLNPKVSPEVREKLIQQYQLDKPFHIQYWNWVSGMARLDFGRSFKDNRPVTEIIGERLPRTILLEVLSLLFAFAVAIPIGILSAVKQNKFIDRALTIFVFVGFSVPTYWVALLSIILFGIYLGWVPITGFQSLMADEMSWPLRMLDISKHLILPVLVSGLTGLAGLSRYVRNGMLEVIRQDYVRTARAKGLPENKVIFHHALKNTLIPVITIIGLSIPGLISSGVIFETIFSYPGLGRLLWEAVVSRNIPVLMASVTFGAFLTLVGNLIADILYAYADPRIRYR